MKKNFRIYKLVELPGSTSDGAHLQWSHGCNGEKHVNALDKVYGEGELKEPHLTQLDVGVCDKSCGHQDLGEFDDLSQRWTSYTRLSR